MAQEKYRVRVLRAFRQGGKPVNVGSVVDVPQHLYFTLRSAGRVEAIAETEKLVEVSDSDAVRAKLAARDERNRAANAPLVEAVLAALAAGKTGKSKD